MQGVHQTVLHLRCCRGCCCCCAAASTAAAVQVATLSPELASTSSSTKAAAEVTQIALAPGGQQLAAGYSDGTVSWPETSSSCPGV
jgi:hypothetical protein